MDVQSVLVIESNEQIGTKIKSALQGAGFMVTCVANALEGLEQLCTSSYSLIVMNSSLPEVCGEDARVLIRRACYLPIIVIGERQDVAESLELGADAFIATPPLLRELVARVKSLLSRKLSLTYKNSTINWDNQILTNYFVLSDDDIKDQYGNN